MDHSLIGGKVKNVKGKRDIILNLILLLITLLIYIFLTGFYYPPNPIDLSPSNGMYCKYSIDSEEFYRIIYGNFSWRIVGRADNRCFVEINLTLYGDGGSILLNESRTIIIEDRVVMGNSRQLYNILWIRSSDLSWESSSYLNYTLIPEDYMSMPYRRSFMNLGCLDLVGVTLIGIQENLHLYYTKYGLVLYWGSDIHTFLSNIFNLNIDSSIPVKLEETNIDIINRYIRYPILEHILMVGMFIYLTATVISIYQYYQSTKNLNVVKHSNV